MSNHQTHDQVIAKLQHFADNLHNRKLEKEALSLSLDKSEKKTEVYNEILIYEEIIDEYHQIFENIIVR
jgi:hypothetical protein